MCFARVFESLVLKSFSGGFRSPDKSSSGGFRGHLKSCSVGFRVHLKSFSDGFRVEIKKLFGAVPGSFSGSFSGWFSGSFSEMGFCHRPLPKAVFVFENNWVPKTVWGREKEPHITLGASTQCEWFALDRSNSEGPFWGWAGSSNPGRAFHPPAPHPRRTLGHL